MDTIYFCLLLSTYLPCRRLLHQERDYRTLSHLSIVSIVFVERRTSNVMSCYILFSSFILSYYPTIVTVSSQFSRYFPISIYPYLSPCLQTSYLYIVLSLTSISEAALNIHPWLKFWDRFESSHIYLSISLSYSSYLTLYYSLPGFSWLSILPLKHRMIKVIHSKFP